MSEGCEQRQRAPAALDEGFFRPDELSFEALAAMSAGLAERLRYVDHHGRPAGHWGPLFDADESLVMARLLALDPAALRAGFERDFDAATPAALARQLLALAQRLDHGLKALSAQDGVAARSLCERLRRRIALQLGADLQGLFERYGADLVPERSATALAALRERFDAVWQQPAAAGDGSAGSEAGREREALRAGFFALLQALAELRTLARELLPASLRTQQHEPAAGLLIAFWQLYATVQQRLNRFDQRHIDFYYRDCLGLAPRPAAPDQVLLVCRPEPRAELPLLLPRGTAFAAGKDDAGRLVEFRSDHALWLTDARVVALGALRQQRDPAISPEREFGYLSRIKAAGLGAAELEAAADAATAVGRSLGQRLNAAGGEARLGLLLAHPLLLLAEGRREITLTLRLQPLDEADREARRLLQEVVRQLPPEAPADPQHDPLPPLLLRYLELEATLQPGADADPATLRPLAARLAGTLRPVLAALDAEARAARCWLLFALHWLQAAADAAQTRHRLGRLFSRWLLGSDDDLGDAELAQLRSATAQLSPDLDPAYNGAATRDWTGDPLSLMWDRRRPERELVFHRLLGLALQPALSQPQGWWQPPDCELGRVEPTGAAGSRAGFRLKLYLRPEDPPICAHQPAVHGAGWPPGLPLLRLQVASQGRMYPVSLLQGWLLQELRLEVEVQGLRQLALHNQLGRLDPARASQPFGPLPTVGAGLLIAAPEPARKSLSALALQLEWADLPREIGGFDAHYAGYGPALAEPRFAATLGLLHEGRWHDQAEQPLFDLAADGRPLPRRRITLDPDLLRRHSRPGELAPDLGLDSRNGLLRLQLSSPPEAFGHRLYPGRLSDALAANARRPRHPQPLPAAPYTPTLARLSLDYRAEAQLRPGDPFAAESGDDGWRLFHLHPFGHAQLHPATGLGQAPPLLPDLGPPDSLYIGLAASQLQGPLSLLFELRDEAVPATASVAAMDAAGERRPPPCWAVLADNRWRPLADHQLLADSTQGLQSSGIVSLDLPDLARRGNSVLDGALYWLRLSSDTGFDRFAAVAGVQAQALQATRSSSLAPLDGDGSALLPPGRIVAPLATLRGLAGVTQVGPSFGARPAESERQLRTRAGERLHHRQRASAPWDYERLLLEQYPELFKVKCFAATDALPQPLPPGSVLVAVVPALRRNVADSSCRGPRLDALRLQQMARSLQALASPAARVLVRNAAYERIQVRCRLGLAPGSPPGLVLRRANRALVEYLSPWYDDGAPPAFGWQLRCEDLEGLLRRVDGVAEVGGLSLLQVTEYDDGLYTLGDTARRAGGRLQARLPWSLALPLADHLLALADAPADAAPEPSGIEQLGLGSTFIVGAPQEAVS